MRQKTLFMLVSLVLLAVLVTGCGGTKVGTAPDGNEVAIETAAMKLVKAQTENGYQLVDTATLKQWIDEKKDMVIIDTMPNDFYKKGHIPGAVNAELPKTSLADATEEQKSAFINLLPADKNKPIVIYCGFVACARSNAGAILAIQQGYTNVYRYPGGITAWNDAKYPTSK